MKTLNVGKGIYAGGSGANRSRRPPVSIDPSSPNFLGHRSKDPITIYVQNKISGVKDKRFKPNNLGEQST